MMGEGLEQGKSFSKKSFIFLITSTPNNNFLFNKQIPSIYFLITLLGCSSKLEKIIHISK